MDKLSEIENIADGDEASLVRLIELSYDKDEEVRFRAIEAFYLLPLSKKILERVRESLDDSDEMVRITGIELLGEWRDVASKERLYDFLIDKDPLIFSAAIISLAQLGGEEVVQKLKEKTVTDFGLEGLSVSIGLYILGEELYLNRVLSFLEDENYQVRCAAANLVSQFAKTKDIKIITTRLKSALKKESTKAASSSMMAAIKELEDAER